jgi:hypothetical protein
MPLVTLTAGLGSTQPDGARWFALHEEIAARSTAGEARLVPDSGHLMMRDQPGSVWMPCDRCWPGAALGATAGMGDAAVASGGNCSPLRC